MSSIKELVPRDMFYTKSAFTLYSFKYTSSINLALKYVAEKIKSDGIDVAYIISNYQSDYHPDYIGYSKKIQKEIKDLTKSKRGRPKKPVKEKIKKKNDGSGEYFSSSFTMGIIHNGNVVGVKIFCKKSGNVPSITVDDIDYVKEILDKAFNVIRKSIPEIEIDYKDVSIKLRAMRYNFFDYMYLREQNENYLVDDDYDGPAMRINVYRLYKIIEKNKDTYDFDVDGINNKLVSIYNGKDTFLRILIPIISNTKREKNYDIQIDPSGKIYITGGCNDDISYQILILIIQIIYDYKDYVIQMSIPTLKKVKNTK